VDQILRLGRPDATLHRLPRRSPKHGAGKAVMTMWELLLQLGAVPVYDPVRAVQRLLGQQIDWPSTLLLKLMNLCIPLFWVLLATLGLPLYMLSVPLAFRNHLGGRTGWVKSARSIEG
jgi:hypothetical protein